MLTNCALISGEFNTVGQWTMNIGEKSELVLDDLSVIEPPIALKQNKQVLKVQTVTVSSSEDNIVYLLLLML